MKTLETLRAELEANTENVVFSKMVDGVSLTCSSGERAAILDDRAPTLFAAQLCPDEVSFRNLAFALLQAGLYEQVEAVALSTTAGKIWWNTAQSTTVRRDHSFVAALANAIGQTNDQLDAIFIAAKDL